MPRKTPKSTGGWGVGVGRRPAPRRKEGLGVGRERRKQGQYQGRRSTRERGEEGGSHGVRRRLRDHDANKEEGVGGGPRREESEESREGRGGTPDPPLYCPFLPLLLKHPTSAFVASWAGLHSHANPLAGCQEASGEDAAGASNATYSQPLSQLMFLFWAPHYFLL